MVPSVEATGVEPALHKSNRITIHSLSHPSDDIVPDTGCAGFAEREGFEPPSPLTRTNRLAVSCLHHSATSLFLLFYEGKDLEPLIPVPRNYLFSKQAPPLAGRPL